MQSSFTSEARYHVVVRVGYTYSVFKSELPCFFLNKTIQSPNFELVRSPRIDSKEPMRPDGVAWQADTTTLFLLGSLSP
jgi:hypothetical protein